MVLTLIIAAFFGGLGAVLASFIGVVAERAYTGQSWRRGRSRCNSCCRDLAARDLVPVLSWMLYRGRCRTCKARVPALYTLYEIALGFLFAFSFLTFGLSLALASFLTALCVLAFVVMYDLRHTLVPTGGSSLLIASCALFALATAETLSSLVRTTLIAAVIALFFFGLYYFSKGRAMGLGDTPVSFALALLAGERALPGFLFSFWVGGVIGLGILVLRRGGPRMGIEVPFVPFLAAGFLLAVFTTWNPLPF